MDANLVPEELVEAPIKGDTGAEQEQPQAPVGCKAKVKDFICSGPCFPTRQNWRDSESCFDSGCKKESMKKPLLDSKGLVACGYKSQSPLRPKQQWCCLILIILVIWVLCGSILQWVCFHFATLHCSSGSPADDYSFPGGESSDLGDGSFNLVPRLAIMVERKPQWFGMGFDVYTATENRQIKGAPVGTWFRTWGPFFSTYTYQDVMNSQPTIYMRASIQGMLAGYVDNYVMRCDGKGEYGRISEGQHAVGNHIRHALGFNQGYTLKVWQGGTMVGIAEETFHGGKSITFRAAEGKKNPYATGTLQGQKFQDAEENKFSQWSVENHVDSKVPYYQVNGMTVLYAFKIYNDGHRRDLKEAKEGKHPEFLAEEMGDTAVTERI